MDGKTWTEVEYERIRYDEYCRIVYPSGCYFHGLVYEVTDEYIEFYDCIVIDMRMLLGKGVKFFEMKGE